MSEKGADEEQRGNPKIVKKDKGRRGKGQEITRKGVQEDGAELEVS